MGLRGRRERTAARRAPAPASSAGVARHAGSADVGLPSPEPRAAAPLEDEVFTSCGAAVTWGDVREWMVDDRTWAVCARRAAQGAAHALGDGPGPSGGALRQAAQRFRRERKLIAREDLAAWLARWAISEEEWVDWLDRSLRREGAAAPAAGGGAGEQETWVEAVCSGELGAAARRMAQAFGAWGERDAAALPPPQERLAVLRRAYAELVARAPEPWDLERTISANAAGWLEIAFESVSFPTADGAREGLAACRDDGATLASVAALAGVEVEGASVRADEVEPRLRAVVVSAPLDVPVLAATPERPGLVVTVRGRRHPTLDDEDDRRRAAHAVAEQRVQSAVDRWVVWRG